MINIRDNSDFIIFFDESGKAKGSRVQLMGAFGLPSKIYFNNEHLKMRKLNEKYNYHWKEYKGDSKQRTGIIKLFQEAHSLAEYSYLNFIKYFSSDLSSRSQKYDVTNAKTDRSIIHEMIYSKLPERIIYGLLRGYGNPNSIVAAINIEDACEYRTIDLGENLKKQLNIHSLYRGESFVIGDCQYKEKGEELGVEFTDILLGVVRTILENNDMTSRRKNAQIKLIIYLLQKNLLQLFIYRMRLFELRNSVDLIALDIMSSVNMFISKNYDLYTK